MTYTCHVGDRQDAWPPQVGSAETRADAQRLVKDHLAAAPADQTKGEVRLRMALLDTYGKLRTGTIRHVHGATQRQRGDAELPL